MSGCSDRSDIYEKEDKMPSGHDPPRKIKIVRSYRFQKTGECKDHVHIKNKYEYNKLRKISKDKIEHELEIKNAKDRLTLIKECKECLKVIDVQTKKITIPDAEEGIYKVKIVKDKTTNRCNAVEVLRRDVATIIKMIKEEEKLASLYRKFEDQLINDTKHLDCEDAKEKREHELIELFKYIRSYAGNGSIDKRDNIR